MREAFWSAALRRRFRSNGGLAIARLLAGLRIFDADFVKIFAAGGNIPLAGRNLS